MKTTCVVFLTFMCGVSYFCEACAGNEKRVRCPKSGYIPGKQCAGVASWKCTPGRNRCGCKDDKYLNINGQCVDQKECGANPYKSVFSKRPTWSQKQYKNASKLFRYRERLALTYVSKKLRGNTDWFCIESGFLSSKEGIFHRTIESRTVYREPSGMLVKETSRVSLVLTNYLGRNYLRLSADGNASDILPFGLSNIYTLTQATDSCVAMAVGKTTDGNPLCLSWAKKGAAKNSINSCLLSWKSTCAGPVIDVREADKVVCELWNKRV
ncbi:uncharacterized protein [Dermacentor andersoni]|uniref:uncharacterized protein n=1 Tax=Dermacentor andersoni TaxID=34620 RepID=UPI003B3A4752